MTDTVGGTRPAYGYKMLETPMVRLDPEDYPDYPSDAVVFEAHGAGNRFMLVVVDAETAKAILEDRDIITGSVHPGSPVEARVRSERLSAARRAHVPVSNNLSGSRPSTSQRLPGA